MLRWISGSRREIEATIAHDEHPAPSTLQQMMAAHDTEQAWRSRGEPAIRAEMDRRIRARLAKGS